MHARMTASLLALAAFAIAIVMGIVADNSEITTLQRALLAMFCCYLLGYAVGWIGQRAAVEHVQRYKQSHPIPSEDADPDSQVKAASENAADTTPQDASGLRPRSQSQAA